MTYKINGGIPKSLLISNRTRLPQMKDERSRSLKFVRDSCSLSFNCTKNSRLRQTSNIYLFHFKHKCARVHASAAIKNRPRVEGVGNRLSHKAPSLLLRLTLRAYLHLPTDSESTVPIHVKETVPVPKSARRETIECRTIELAEITQLERKRRHTSRVVSSHSKGERSTARTSAFPRPA